MDELAVTHELVNELAVADELAEGEGEEIAVNEENVV
jgi:hypothetical protein